MVLASRLWAPEKPNLDELIRRPAWQRDALCLEYPEVDFFTGQGEATEPAKAICARCPVRDECLEHALENLEVGVWGGTSTAQRKKMRRLAVSESGRAVPRPQDRTHCAQGHPFDEENTRVRMSANGYRTRICRTCTGWTGRVAASSDMERPA
jgi:WhiB family redox-sensing transcriptional regulator